MTPEELRHIREVLARRTPASVLMIDRGGITVRTGPTLRSVLRLAVARRSDDIQSDHDLDAISLGWQVLPDLLAEVERLRAAVAAAEAQRRDAFELLDAYQRSRRRVRPDDPVDEAIAVLMDRGGAEDGE